MFEWDESKRRATIDKHGLDFQDAVHIFQAPYLRLRSHHADEQRFIAVGRPAEWRLCRSRFYAARRGHSHH